jgi:hypothetical protein
VQVAESQRLFRACEVTEVDLLLLYIGPAGDLQNLHMYTDSLAFERLVYFYFESSVSVIALLLKSIVYQIYA